MKQKNKQIILSPIGNRIINRLENAIDLFIRKNQGYKDSFIKTGQVINLILDNHPVTLKTADDHNSYALIVRKLDKLIRYLNLRFGKAVDKVGEKCVETMNDDGVYSFMLAEVENIQPKKKVRSNGVDKGKNKT